jgi:beta-carotene/zeaxanthin 4-ketolase
MPLKAPYPNVSLRQHTRLGIALAIGIIALWVTVLAIGLNVPLGTQPYWLLLLIPLQTHLFTGLFISAHDAMHGTLAPLAPKNNRFLGIICAGLFAFNDYRKLLPAHHNHHRHVATENDPDYHPPGFWPWYLKFLRQYLSIWQLLLVAVFFNVGLQFFPLENLLAMYVVPSILSTLQLFYFGTYLPHRGEHDAENPHFARSQKKNHWLAFFTCYFFGYHFEHHDSPATPWWQLHKLR